MLLYSNIEKALLEIEYKIPNMDHRYEGEQAFQGYPFSLQKGGIDRPRVG